MEITVKFFAVYREKSGTSKKKMDLPKDSTVGSLVNEIVQLFPSLTQKPSTLLVAVNDEYKDHKHILAKGDEVALIPPVSGGSI